MILGPEQILEYLPHRPPFVWIDAVLELDPGERCVAIKSIGREEEFFDGHFPSNPIVPGVYLIEAAAQTAGVMMARRIEEGESRMLAAVERFRFLRPVGPSSEIRIEACKLAEAGTLMQVEVILRTEGEVVARGELCLSSR